MNGLSLNRGKKFYRPDNKELKEEIAQLWEQVANRDVMIKQYAKEITERDSVIDRLEMEKSRMKDLQFDEIEDLKCRIAHLELELRLSLKKIEELQNISVLQQVKNLILLIIIRLKSIQWRKSKQKN